MLKERFFYTQDGKHRLYVDIYEVECMDGSVLMWNASWDICSHEFPQIVETLRKAAGENLTRQEREVIVERAFDLTIKAMPFLRYQWLPEYILDKRGRLCESLKRFYEEKEQAVEMYPFNYVKYKSPYSEQSNTLTFRLIGREITKGHIKFLNDCVSIPITRDQFEEQLSNDRLKAEYVEHYDEGNQHYLFWYEFPQIHWLNTYYIVNNYKVPFFFFSPSKINNYKQKHEI